jgi:hypothetical protein
MTKHMWTDLLPLERRARARGSGGILGDDTFNRIAAQLSASGADKERIFGTAAAFAQPTLQHLHGFRPQRRTPVFPAFSLAVDVRAGSQNEILTSQAC